MATADNEKRTARIPIILDDVTSRKEHKNLELLMDYLKDDIYLYKDGKYINITGTIKDSIKEIQDSSCAIHIVTPDTVPPVKDRKANNWYLIIQSAVDMANSDDVKDLTTYIYYGVVDKDYYTDRNYLLVSQNMTTGEGNVHVNAPEGYKVAFYIPVDYEAKFKNAKTDEVLSFTPQDRLYILTPQNRSVAYDVYMSDDDALGDIWINLTFTSSAWYTVTLMPNHSAIDNLVMPESERKVPNGDAIGKLDDPTWTENRYIFKGWSTDNVNANIIDPTTWKPTQDCVLYAFFEYNDSADVVNYHAVYRSSTGKLIGELYSVDKIGTVIKPHDYDGYTTPATQTLVQAEQEFVFVYTPDTYTISYDLAGGKWPNGVTPKTSYTIEDSYTPPEPEKDSNTFYIWNPITINAGSMGNVKFTANWIPNSVTVTGSELQNLLTSLDSTIPKKLAAIQESSTTPPDNVDDVNITTSGSPIYVWYTASTLTLSWYCANTVQFNPNMAGAFEGFTSLRNIAGLSSITMKPTTNIEKMFSGCVALSDVSAAEDWDMTAREHFTDTFKNTMAYNTSKLPSWYVYTATIKCVYGSTVLKTTTKDYIPGTEVWADDINGYKKPTKSITIDGDKKTYTFTYTK